ncbi:MAG: ribonuclease HI [Halanaerobiaceae bacterium]|nr:ribonuclease HI [Halanaerobiaceae bacterium]
MKSAVKYDGNLFDKNNFYLLYTDGACSGNPGPGAYAAIIIQDGNESVISGYEAETTNNRMELKAVIEGLKKIPEGSKVYLYSDSNYVLQGLEEWIKGWKEKDWKTTANKKVKNQDLWKELDVLISKYELEYVKIKGHSGDEYNERADSLARKELEKNQNIE